MTNPHWNKERKYRHIDLPVSTSFINKVTDPNFVKSHSFSPLIHYDKKETKYKLNMSTGDRATDKKKRPIKYACHRDACVYSYYSYLLSQKLEDEYDLHKISSSVAAYRSNGLSNYDHAAAALRYAEGNKPIFILAFDVSGFFDTLDHKTIKSKLKDILGVESLSQDWLKVYNNITKFSFFTLEDIKNSTLRDRVSKKARGKIATVSELKNAKIKFYRNPELANRRGIPQGTPISATISNLYMLDFDIQMAKNCECNDAMYIRYSDDILVLCKEENVSLYSNLVRNLLSGIKLELADSKTEVIAFDDLPKNRFTQYLGFKFTDRGPIIREGTLSRQWRSLRSKIKSANYKKSKYGYSKIYKKKLYKKFICIKTETKRGLVITRNFSSYARRSHDVLGFKSKILKQAKSFERSALREIRKL